MRYPVWAWWAVAICLNSSCWPFFFHIKSGCLCSHILLLTNTTVGLWSYASINMSTRPLRRRLPGRSTFMYWPQGARHSGLVLWDTKPSQQMEGSRLLKDDHQNQIQYLIILFMHKSAASSQCWCYLEPQHLTSSLLAQLRMFPTRDPFVQPAPLFWVVKPQLGTTGTAQVDRESTEGWASEAENLVLGTGATDQQWTCRLVAISSCILSIS